MYDATVGGSPSADGDAVGRWIADDGETALSQASSGLRPVCDTDRLPGRTAMIVSADRRLTGAVPLPVSMALLVVAGLSGSRTVLTIDTTATTTKPAAALVIEEYVGT